MLDLKANTLEHTWAVNQAETVVVLDYQSFCSPCNSTQPHLESLAAQRGFALVKVNRDRDISPEHAGAIVPSVSVYKRGRLMAPPLRRARTRLAIEQYLADHGIFQ